jgi:hypothetical protein
MPLHWTITADDLSSLPGIGAQTARRIIACLDES